MNFLGAMKTRKRSNPIDPERSALMARVRRRHSAPEQAVRKILRSLEIPYRLHRRSLPGTPDIVLPDRRYVIFVHGCFWHRHASCSKATMPKSRISFWVDKFEKNVTRDRRNTRAIRKLGWKVVTVWECQCEHPEKLSKRLKRSLSL
jgi:DNA mismatch endonuclease, patch repair protein